jgi:hypothetical protein
MSDTGPFPKRQRARRVSKSLTEEHDRRAVRDPESFDAVIRRVIDKHPSPMVTEAETSAIVDAVMSDLRSAGASPGQIEQWALESAELFLEDSLLSIEQRELCASVVLTSCGWELARWDTSAGVRYDFLRGTAH